MKYKVGDKVRLKQWVGLNESQKQIVDKHIGEVGIITRVEHTMYPYQIEWKTCPVGIMLESEIELLEQQLLFSFMEEDTVSY